MQTDDTQAIHDIISTDVELSVSDGTQMNAFVCYNDRAKHAPGVLVLQEAFGVNAHIRDVAMRFARAGFVAIAPELYHRTAPKHFDGPYNDFSKVVSHYQALTTEGLTADFKAAQACLQGIRAVDAKKLVAVGFCMGGRAAFLANAVLPLKASVSFYGGGIAPDLLPMAPKLHGRQLLIWGGRDKHIGPEQIAAVESQLRSANKDFVSVTFSPADHGFFCDQRPSYHADSATEAWALSLEFLRNSLLNG